MTHEARFAALKLTLPPVPTPMATYATAVTSGNLLYTAGHGPLRPDGTFVTGKAGKDLDVAGAREAARYTALAVLATVRAHLGSLDRIVRMVKVLGLVNATPDFAQHPQVINGFSDLMVEVLGDAGLAARSAFGAASLPSGIAVEIEAIFEIAPR
jgi:enamine deaminase RidA (YjgF/YER057c/UK114 family)